MEDLIESLLHFLVWDGVTSQCRDKPSGEKYYSYY